MSCEISLLKAIILVFFLSFFFPQVRKKGSGLFRVYNDSGTLLAAQGHRPWLSSTWELLPQQWQCEDNRAAAEPPSPLHRLRGNFLHTVIGLHIKTCLERRREKGSGQAMNNANGEAFIINNCLLSDTLTLLSADVNTKGSLWAITEGRWGQDTARRLGRDGWPGPESPQIVMKVGLTQGTVETDRASAGGTAMGEEITEF